VIHIVIFCIPEICSLIKTIGKMYSSIHSPIGFIPCRDAGAYTGTGICRKLKVPL